MFLQFQTKESGVVCKLLKEILLSQIEPQINSCNVQVSETVALICLKSVFHYTPLKLIVK